MLVDMRKYRFENVPREGKPCHLSVIHSKANPVTYLLYIAITIGVPAKIESSGLKPLNIKLWILKILNVSAWPWQCDFNSKALTSSPNVKGSPDTLESVLSDFDFSQALESGRVCNPIYTDIPGNSQQFHCGMHFSRINNSSHCGLLPDVVWYKDQNSWNSHIWLY